MKFECNPKKLHFAEKCLANQGNSSKIWKEIKSLVNLKPNKNFSIKILDDNNNIINDPMKISNVFNDYFSTLGSNIQQKIPNQEGNYKYYLDKRDKNGKRFINPDGCTFYLSPVDPLEIDKLIDELDSKKSSGPFGVPVSLLKNTENSFLFGYPNL